MRKKAIIVGVVALLLFSGVWGVESVLAEDVGLVGLLPHLLPVSL